VACAPPQLHALGFAVFIAYVLPAHYKLFGIGLSVTAYTLGLRHAFDADHISAIDNTTRRAMSQRQGTSKPRPFAFGYFFSLGHSTIVVAIGVGIIIAEKTVLPAVTHSNSSLESFGATFGTIVSAAFLFLIALLNLIILAGIFRVFLARRRGEYNEAELEQQLEERGFFYRFFGRWMKRHRQGMADVPGRRGTRHGVRYRHRGRSADHHGAACLRAHPLAGHRCAAHPVHRRHESHGHQRRPVHERRLRLGLLQPHPQGLLELRSPGSRSPSLVLSWC
jgi:hypothetical protein